MGKIVAIGGGEIGRQGYPIETLSIDKEIVALSGKKNPTLLFIPTASKDSEGYVSVVHEYFGKCLGCKVDTLYLVKDILSRRAIRKKILSSDIVYVGGGDTLYMLRLWRRKGVDIFLKEAYDKGIVLSGVSAGALCWFDYGSSDTKRFQNSYNASLTRVRGLGLISALASPHHLREPHRREGIIRLMKRTRGIGLALDDCVALEIVNDRYRVLSAHPKSTLHKVYYKQGELFYHSVIQRLSFTSLTELLSK